MIALQIFLFVGMIVSQAIGNADVPSPCVTSTCGRSYPCSENSDCECLQLASVDRGICGASVLPCSSMVPCNKNNFTCPILNTVCINSTRCVQPVCYPLPLASPLVCPSYAANILTTSKTTTTSVKRSSPCTITIPHDNRWICSNATAFTNGGSGTFYLEQGAVLLAHGAGSTTVYLQAGASFNSQGGGSNLIYYEFGAQWQYEGGGSNTEIRCSPLIFDYSNVPSDGCFRGLPSQQR